MPQIIITVTNEEMKAVNGIVEDAEVWIENAWKGKVSNCMKRVILAESNLNPAKMTGQDQSDWVKNNNFKTRKQKDIDNTK